MLGRKLNIEIMQRIIKSTLVLGLIILLASPVLAQQRKGDTEKRPGREMLQDVPPEVRTEAHIAVLDEYLDLTESQENQIREVDEEFALKGEQIREEKVNRRKKMMMAKELREEHQQAIHEILTKEQYAIYLEKKEAIQYDIRQRLKDHSKDGK